MVAVPAGRSVGTPVVVDASAALGLLQRVRDQLEASPRRAAEATGSVLVEFLRSEPAAPAGAMRVATGLMRRSYFWRLSGQGQTRLQIVNSARSEDGNPYPSFVEARYRPVARTFARHRPAIVAEVKADLVDGIMAARSTQFVGRPSVRRYRR